MTYHENVQRVADRIQVGIDHQDTMAYVKEVSRMRDRFAEFDVSVPEDEPASAVDTVDNEYNAIRYRFELTNSQGELSDLSIGVKDNIAVAGVPMHCGSAALSYTPDHHAIVTDRLRNGGANVVATTNMDEFASSSTGESCAFGPTKNPRVEGHMSGGSSSGSAAAVAAGIVDATLGSDTAGSVRIPASFCGVVGLKPTYRAVPRFGFVGLAPSLDCIGPLATNVRTVARVYDRIAGSSPYDPSSLASHPTTDAASGVDESVDGHRVGVVDSAMTAAADDVTDSVATAVNDLAEAGIEVERVTVPRFDQIPTAGLAILGAEFSTLGFAQGHLFGTNTGYDGGWRDAVAEAFRSPDLAEHVRDQLLTSGALCENSTAHYVAAKAVAAEFTETVTELLDRYDALVLPTTPMTAPEFGAVKGDDDFVRTVALTIPFNLTGHPALSVPVKSASDGAPVGIQCVGNYHTERTLVEIGSALENR